MGLALPLTRPAIEAYQLAQIRETMARARAASPFYRSRTDWPDGVFDSLADVPRLPFTWPRDLRRNDPALGAVPQSEIARIVTLGTSGTSGAPKRVCFTADDLEATVDFFHHGMALFTRPGERVVIVFPGERPGSVGEALARAAKRLGAEPSLASPDLPVEALVALLRAERPAVVFGPPVRLLAAARVSACDGGPGIAIRAALVSSDNIPRALRRSLGSLWGCEVFAHWGMTETGLGGALDCRFHAGLHVRESDLYVEVIDPATGAPVRAGLEGEIVVTTLRQQGLPLIRYRTGDLGRLVTGPCPCGSVLHGLDGLSERLGARVLLPCGGYISMAMLDEALFGLDAVTDFTAVLDEAAPMHLVLTVATPQAFRMAAVGEAVHRRLVGEPAIAAALASGALRLKVELIGASTCRHAGKRRLVRRMSDREASMPARDWPKAVLFDLDGTLIDSAPDVHAALNETIAHYGVPPLTLEAVKRIIGGGARRLVARAFATAGASLDPGASNEIVERFLANWRTRATKLTTLCQGASEVTRRLADEGMKLAVVTNKGTRETTAILQQFGLSDVMTTVVGGDAGPPKKPDPALVLLACERLGVDTAEAVFVGDSEYDVCSALAAKMKVVVVRGGCSEHGADNLGATRVIDGLSELPRILRLLRDSP